MLYGPDCTDSDEEGLSDDNEYYEYKQRLKNKQKETFHKKVVSEAEQKKKQLQTLSSAILYERQDSIFNEFDKGLDIDVDLDGGWTPLLLACTRGNVHIISELIRRGANVNKSKVVDDVTPLMLLCNMKITPENEGKDILPSVKLLLEKGANVNAIDRKRRTAVMFAAENGHLEVVKFLLPQVDKEAEDNQRWTALFWAVSGNRLEIVQLLLKEDFSYEKSDIRGNTISDIAHSNGFESILNLLPKEQLDDEFYSYLNNNQANFESIFADLKSHEKPQLFTEICKILYGCKSETLIPVLAKSEIGLSDFLSLNDSKLKNLGIVLPFQRHRILGGLYKFHKKPFQPKSVPFVPKNDLFTNIDVSTMLLTYIRQVIAMEASLKFMLENYREESIKETDLNELIMLLRKNRLQIKRLKALSARFVTQSGQWDLMLKPADKITRKRLNIPWGNLWVSVIILSLGTVIWLKRK